MSHAHQSDPHQQIRDAVRALCADFPDEYFRKIDAEKAYPEAFVDALAQGGWLAALIPEEYGGSGLGLAEASVIMEEINRSGGNAGACHGQMYNMGTLVRHGSEEQKRAFLVQQFGAQRSHYRAHFPDSAFDLIELRGKPIGRLYLDERETRVHVIDIALIPDNRDAGIGTLILTAIQDRARARGKGVGIFVERINPAKSLYDRLGFKVIREEDIYLEMDWAPDGVS